jgi:hypothetical protein
MTNPHIFVTDPPEPEEPPLSDYQKAAIEVTTVMTEARGDIVDHQMQARELLASAAHLTKRSAAVVKAIGGELRPLAIGLGIAGLIVWPAAYVLEFLLFQSLLHSTITAALLAAVFAATFVGVGNLLLDHTTLVPILRGDTPPQRLIAATLLALLLAGGIALSLALGPARAQELLGATIRTDQATLQNLRNTGADSQTLEVAATTLAADQATLAMDTKVSTITVLVLVASEITLGGFAIDFLAHAHQKTLTRRARHALQDARGQDDAANQVAVDVRATLAAIGLKHGVSQDDIDAITIKEEEAHRRVRDSRNKSGTNRAPNGEGTTQPGAQTGNPSTGPGPTRPRGTGRPDVNDPPVNSTDPPGSHPRPLAPGDTMSTPGDRTPPAPPSPNIPVEDTGEIF